MTTAETPRRGGTILGRSGQGHGAGTSDPAEDLQAGAADIGTADAGGPSVAGPAVTETVIDGALVDEIAAPDPADVDTADVDTASVDTAGVDTATGGDGDDDGADGDTGPRIGARVPWPVAAMVGLAVVALLLALLGLQQHNQLQHERNQTSDLKRVSGQLIVALTTYDYQHLDQWQSAVLAHATGSFRNGFNSRFGGVSQLLTATHNRATSTVQGIFVGDVQAGRASTVVVVDVTVTGLSGTRQFGSYDKLTVLKVNGQWQVDDIETLNFDPTTGASATPGGATATTQPGVPPAQAPTTAPAGSGK